MRILFIQLMLLLFIGNSHGQTILTFAGGGASTGDGGVATTALLITPWQATFDTYGNYYVAEGGASRIRKINTSGIISTIAGTGTAGYNGDGILATGAKIRNASSVACDKNGNIYIADYGNNRVRKIDVNTGIITTIAGTGIGGYNGDGIPAISAQLYSPSDLCFDKIGNLYIADVSNFRVRKIDTFGIITTYAGNGTSGTSGEGGPATAAQFVLIGGIAVDTGNALHIADWNGGKVKRVNSSGLITTIAGTGTSLYSGDEIPALSANISPIRIAFNRLNELFIVDNPNDRVRKVDNSGVIHTIAGNGLCCYSGDYGPASSAKIGNPGGIAIDSCGSIYISQVDTPRIRKVYNIITPSATLSITPSTTGPICAGTTVNYSAAITGGGTTVNYSWYINSAVVTGATGSSYSYAPAAGDTIRCKVTTFNNCSMPVTATSNGVVLTVTPAVTPAVSIAIAPNDTICAGTAVTLIATPTNGGATPAYQWYKNGSPVTTGTTYSYTPANNDSVRCMLTSSAGCVTTPIAASSTITITVTLPVTPAISIAIIPNDTVCAGTAVTLTATPSNGGTSPAYQWYKNGSAVTTGTTYSYTPANNDSVYCTLTSSASCVTTPIAASSTITITVTAPVTPAISIAITPDDTVCAGTAVTLTATATNGGASPAYQWYKNGSAIATGSIYSYTPANNDSVRCILSSSAACAAPIMAGSNSITITVNPMVTPGVSITINPDDTVCAGTAVTLTATATGAGPTPAYQWYKNGSPVTTGTTYSYTPANNDSVRCLLTGSAACATALTAGSNIITITLVTSVSPGISIAVSPNDTVCTGTPVTFTSFISGGGTAPTYQWYRNGIPTSTGITYSYTPTFDDVVNCTLNSNATCALVESVGSNTIAMQIDTFVVPTLTITAPIAVAPGSTVTVTAVVSNAGSTYTIHWLNNGTEFTTTTIPEVSYIKGTGTDTITARVVSADEGCYDSTTSSAQIVIADHTGVPTIERTEIVISPNPVSNLLYLSESVPYKLIAVTGRVVATGTGSVIDIEQLPAGVYLLQVGVLVYRVVRE